MNLKSFLKSTFGKDMFSHLKKDDILEVRIRTEKKIEMISNDIGEVQSKIQRLMLESKGQPKPMKLLNIQKIKALRLESATKQNEAEELLKQLQLLLLVEAMREHQEVETKNEFIEKLLDSDIDHINSVLFDEDVKKAIEDGKMDEVKDKLKNTFAKNEMPTDRETNELLSTIDDLENVDEETALRMAEDKAREISEAPLKKKVVEE